MVLNLPITTAFAGTLGLIYTALSINVVRYRRKLLIPIGDGTFDLVKEVAHKKEGAVVDTRKYNQLMSAVRAHANFIEYVPFQLILAALLELQGYNSQRLKFILSAFTFARVIHCYGISNLNFRGIGRTFGTILTYVCVLGSSVVALNISNPLSLFK